MRAFILWTAYGLFLVSMATFMAVMISGIYYLWTIRPILGLSGVLLLPTFVALGWLWDRKEALERQLSQHQSAPH